MNNENLFMPFEIWPSNELKNEVAFRNGTIKIEQKEKIKKIALLSGSLLFLLVCVWAYLWIAGHRELAKSMIALGSFGVAYLSYKTITVPTQQQIYEQNTIKNINFILGSRRDL